MSEAGPLTKFFNDLECEEVVVVGGVVTAYDRDGRRLPAPVIDAEMRNGQSDE